MSGVIVACRKVACQGKVESQCDCFTILVSIWGLCRIASGSTPGVQDQLDQIELPLTEPKPDNTPPPDVDLARIGPLQVVLEEGVDEGQGQGLLTAVLQVIPERPSDRPQKGLPTPIRWEGGIPQAHVLVLPSPVSMQAQRLDSYPFSVPSRKRPEPFTKNRSCCLQL